MQASELSQRIKSNSAPVIIDPRSEMEFKRGRIPGAINAPVRKLLVNGVQLPSDENCEIVAACMHGQRARIAKKLLGLHGYRNIVFLDGWIQDWIRDGLPLEK
jgi:rhodanese-related sulfurtransferase